MEIDHNMDKNTFPYIFIIILIFTELECKAERKSTLIFTISKRWWIHTDDPTSFKEQNWHDLFSWSHWI